MHWLHSQLKKTSITTRKVVKKIVSPREVEPLVDVLKLAEGLIHENVSVLETMTNEFKQVKLDTVDKLQALLQSWAVMYYATLINLWIKPLITKLNEMSNGCAVKGKYINNKIKEQQTEPRCFLIRI